MKAARDTGLLFHRYTVQMLRNPVWLFVGFSTPRPLPGAVHAAARSLPGVPRVPDGGVLDVFLPGILALLAFASGASTGFGTIFELQTGVIERFRVTPASRLAILLGPILSGLVDDDVFDAVVVVVGVGFGFHVHWAGLLVLAVLLWLLATLMAAFSTAVALVTKEISSFAAVINGINLPCCCSPACCCRSPLGPLWMRVLAHLNPLYYLVVASRSLAAGTFATVRGVAGVRRAGAAVRRWSLAWATRVFRRAVA